MYIAAGMYIQFRAASYGTYITVYSYIVNSLYNRIARGGHRCLVRTAICYMHVSA